MILLFDLGNTRLKWRIADFSSKEICAGVVEYEALSAGVPVWGDYVDVVSSIVVSSVTSEARNQQLSTLLRAYWPDIEAVFVVTQKRMLGLDVVYEDASRLGVDRAMAMLALVCERVGSFLVLDGGSALTADYVEDGGKHLGGFIVPGWRMLEKSLLKDTANISLSGKGVSAGDLGHSTPQCVQLGVHRMYCASIVDFASLAESKGINKVYVTGGDAGLMNSMLPNSIHRPDLVLDGLLCWALENVAT